MQPNSNMTGAPEDDTFIGPIPKIYESFLVPLIFEPYVGHMADRLISLPLTDVLEIAAGTGVLTRQLAAALPETASIVATDLNQPMLDMAADIGTKRPVQWRQADALHLPFESGSFDAVVCQFGVMFFPDKPAAFSEARRVLRPGGVFLFSAWDRIEESELADTVTSALGVRFPDDPPRFLARTPHGYHDPSIIERDVRSGGFAAPLEIETVAARSRADSPRHPAVGYCLGSPLRAEIEARDPQGLEEATEFAGEIIADRFGNGAVDGKIQAHIVSVQNASRFG
jgi:SAM-dependent methyltransferase